MGKLVENVERFKTINSIKYIESGVEDKIHQNLRFRVNKNNYILTINQNPTYNCQIISIGYIYSILNEENPNKSLQEILSLILQLGMVKNMILVDIAERYVGPLKELFKPYLKNNSYTDTQITLEAPYKSSNGSNMCIILFNINWETIKALNI